MTVLLDGDTHGKILSAENQFGAPVSSGACDSLAAIRARALRALAEAEAAICDMIGGKCAEGKYADLQFCQAALQFRQAARRLADSLATPDEANGKPTSLMKARENRRLPERDLKAALARFTERQMDVFHLVAQGLPNKLIAFELGLSDATVKAHLGAIYRKLRVPNRAKAIVLYNLWFASS